MAVDADLVDSIAAGVADIYRDAETALVRLTARQIENGIARQRLGAVRALRRGAQAIIAGLEADAGPAVRESLATAYRHGWKAAVAELPETWFRRSGIGQAARAALSTIPGFGFVEALATALLRDFGQVHNNMLRDTLDVYRQVQAGAAARVLTGTQTRLEASQSAYQAYLNRGITGFTDRSGRRWSMSAYVEMTARTNVHRAAAAGQVDRLDSLGIDLVYVSDHAQECKLCRPYEGKILRTDAGPTGDLQVEHGIQDGVMVTVHVVDTLDGARANGFQHPMCRHHVSAYFPGVSKLPKQPTADPEGDIARQKQRRLERQIRKAKIDEAGAMTDEAKKKARKAVRGAQEALRQHLDANPFLKRLRYREQIGAGNLPTGGRENDPAAGLGPDIQPPLTGGPGIPQPPAPRQPATPADQGPVDDRAPGLGQDTLPDTTFQPGQVPDAARPFHRNLDGIEDLARRVETLDIVGTRRLGGSAAISDLITLSDGSKAIRKRDRPGRDEGDQDANAEHLASLIARALGLRAPGVYRPNDRDLFMTFADGTAASEAGSDRVAQAVASPEGRRVGLLDMLIGNRDRNSGNWLLTETGGIVPIDHGSAYQTHADDRLVDGPFADHFRDRETDALIPNDLTAAKIAETRAALEALRPDFAHIGQEDRLDYSLRVLDDLAAHSQAAALPARDVRAMSMEDLEAELMAAMDGDFDQDAFDEISGEIDRREAEQRADEDRRAANREKARSRAERKAEQQAAHMVELLEAGWPEDEAVAEAYGISVAKQRRDRAIGDLRAQGYTGRSLDELARASYRDYLYRQWLAAENATNGYLVNAAGRAAGIDPAALFSGPEARARKWASDELKAWWDANGRLSFNDWKAQLLDDSAEIRRLRDQQGGDFLA